MIQLSFYNVTKRYETADGLGVQNLSFDILKGDFVALAGPSGSGKTTALNLAAGLDKPTSGQVHLMSQDLGKLNANELTSIRRQSVGFVFQSYNLFPVLTALENVEYPLALKKVSPAVRRERAMGLLKTVGLAEFAFRFPRELSGGQQQRVAVARAMVTEPEIVFADEPTANLDSKSAELLIELFRNLNKTNHTTFLFSSHDPRVLRAANRVLEMEDGCLRKDIYARSTIPKVVSLSSHKHEEAATVRS